MAHAHAHPTLACASAHDGQRASLSRALQIVSGSDRCPSVDGVPVCGTERPPRALGRTGGALAVGQSVAARVWAGEHRPARGRRTGCASFPRGGVGQCDGDCGRVDGGAPECGAEPTVWRDGLGGGHGGSVVPTYDPASAGATEHAEGGGMKTVPDTFSVSGAPQLVEVMGFFEGRSP